MGSARFKVDLDPTEYALYKAFLVTRIDRSSDSANPFNMADEIDEIPVIRIAVWWPAGWSIGTWTAVVETEGIRHEAEFEVEPFEVPCMSALSSTATDPFKIPKCVVFWDDEPISVRGAGFEPNTYVPVGVYREVWMWPTGGVALLDSAMVNTDQQGNLQAWFYDVDSAVTEGYGRYYVVAIIDPESKTLSQKRIRDNPGYCFEIRDSSVVSQTVAIPTYIPSEGAWKPCPDARESHLHVGDHARVSTDPPLPSRVRDKPGTEDTTVVGQIEPGEEVVIFDGPVCANEMVWWKVGSLEQDLTGWTAEGDRDDFWLDLAEPQASLAPRRNDPAPIKIAASRSSVCLASPTAPAASPSPPRPDPRPIGQRAIAAPQPVLRHVPMGQIASTIPGSAPDSRYLKHLG
jgi:hypothetical protein